MSQLALITLAGLPGTGKSAIAGPVARELGISLIELDRIEAPLLARGISGHSIGWAGYDILSNLAEDQLQVGQSVLLDCVCWTREVRERWQALARTHDAVFKPIEMV